MSSIQSKSITELRAIAQGYGVDDIFKKDQTQLLDAIRQKQTNMQPEPEIVIPKPEYDARLMSRPPAKNINNDWALELMQPYIARGLTFSIDENGERWSMKCGKKNDEGTMRMKPMTLLQCADRVISG